MLSCRKCCVPVLMCSVPVGVVYVHVRRQWCIVILLLYPIMQFCSRQRSPFIRLCGCATWSGHLLTAVPWRHIMNISYNAARLCFIIDTHRPKKIPLCDKRTANAQISLHIRTSSSWHSLAVDVYYSIHLLCKLTMKDLISLRECAGWSGPSLSANSMRAFFVYCVS